MANQAANRYVPSRAVNTITIGAKAATRLWSGSFVFNDAGVGRGGAPTAATPVLGVNQAEVNNLDGADNALDVVAELGCFPFGIGSAGDALTAADYGKDVFAIDDQTVGKTNGGATRPTAGKLVRIENGQAWVQMPVPTTL
ncbi:MAG: hypothetical protein K2Y40_12735 [Reyranella sp.]|nr:hypothetical protein [Reyranella sp.]